MCPKGPASDTGSYPNVTLLAMPPAVCATEFFREQMGIRVLTFSLPTRTSASESSRQAALLTTDPQQLASRQF